MNGALPHCRKEVVLRLDIEGFFDSINFYMVMARAFPVELFPPPARSLLTRLCCYDDALPQGAPTSAAISNLVMKPFDEHMGEWCEKRGVAYTRYCDDLTFSGSFDVHCAKNKAESFLNAMGFSLNRSKTSIVTKHARQTVTGIVVNEKAQVSRQYRRMLRQEVYFCVKRGVTDHIKHSDMQSINESEYLSSLIGKISYVLQINPNDSEFLKALESIKALIQRT